MDTCQGTVNELQQPLPECFDPETTKSQTLDLRHLINKLNYIHFLDGNITTCFRHKQYQTRLSVPAKPQPCTGKSLICTWQSNKELQRQLTAHQFEHLLVNDGQKVLVVHPQSVEIKNETLHFSLPETCKELNSRKFQRHSCADICAQLLQNGSCFQGALTEFSSVSLQVEVRTTPPQTFQWLNPEAPASLILSRRNEVLYSAECTILKQSRGHHPRSVVLTPSNDQVFKFKPKKYRSTRQQLTPSPNIYFRHPLTDKWVDLAIVDISGSGISVTENAQDATLLPGLILPEIDLTFANSDSLRCKAQVVYRSLSSSSGQPDIVKYGIAFLDMHIKEQTRLLAILYQADNKRSYLSNRVDLDALWKFFFDSGFIYPEKYLHLKSNKEAFKKTYQTLYEKKPNIARHFVYQDNGQILAHMSMIRFYRNSWLIHHHAARKIGTGKGGLVVLSQISRYVNEAHRLYSSHLDFVFGYFRPENRFPHRYFGGAAKHINNPKACSIDPFAYFHFHKSLDTQWNLANTLSINRTTNGDLEDLNRFLEHVSGGLMAEALNLGPGCDNDENLTQEYEDLGLTKERHLFSLKAMGNLKAVAIVNISDIGLNMSDINNSIKIIIVEPDGVKKELLYFFLSLMCFKFGLEQIPVLVYPEPLAKELGLPVEKTYNLWILNMLNLDEYFKFCQRILGVNY